MLNSRPRLRHWVMKGLSGSTPVWRAAARAYRQSLGRGVRLVVVVGSYGKTTTTRALSQVLLGDVPPFIQHNARFWVPLAVLRSSPWSSYQVLEVGISKPGQMARAARIVRPDVTVVTSIGTEHHRSLGSLDVTRAEKARMVEALRPGGVAVMNGDDPNVMWMRSRTDCRIVTFGEGVDCDVRASRIEIDWPHGMRLVVIVDGSEHEVRTRLLGRKTVGAILATLAVCHAEGLPIEGRLESLERLPPTTGRLQLVDLPGGSHLIRDDHKSSYETIEVALDLLEAVPSGRKICVLGEVSEPPGSQGAIYKRIGERVAEVADLAILIANKENCRRYAVGAKLGGMQDSSIVRIDQDPLRALGELKRLIEPGDTILLKGRDNQKLARIGLGLTGRDVRCNVRVCRLRSVYCDSCGHLEASWPGDPLEVP